MNLKDSILIAGASIKTETVEAFGMQITIRELNARTAAALGRKITADDKDGLVRWFQACVIDPDTHEPVFTDTKEDLYDISSMRFADVSKVAMAALKLNKLDAEETVKNSEASPSADSSSD